MEQSMVRYLRPSDIAAPISRVPGGPDRGRPRRPGSPRCCCRPRPVPRDRPSAGGRFDPAQRAGPAVRGTPEFLPPDARRDYFYQTRYGDRGKLSHVNWFRSQGLYGLGWKTPYTESVYPFWYGSPGQSTIDESSSRPWPRPLRFFQGLAHPVASGRDVLLRWAAMSRSTTSTRSRRARPLSVSRSTSTGTTAAELTRLRSLWNRQRGDATVSGRPLRPAYVSPRPGILRGSAAIASRRPRP